MNSVRSSEEVLGKIEAVSLQDIACVVDRLSDISGYSGVLVSRNDLDLKGWIK